MENTSLSEKLKKLALPFPAEDVEWRIGRAGETNGKVWASALAYITNRAIMNRLDEVCGANNWKNEYAPAPCTGVLCGLSIYDEEKKEWITKWDGAENTDVEPVKGGLSDSMKRAGVHWGIGRYLYNLTEGWANIVDDTDKKAMRGSYKDPADPKKYKSFRWYPPELPMWALPIGSATPEKTTAPVKPTIEAVTKAINEAKTADMVEKLHANAQKYVWTPEQKEKINEAKNHRLDVLLLA